MQTILLIFGFDGFIHLIERELTQGDMESPHKSWVAVIGCLSAAWIITTQAGGSGKTIEEGSVPAIISVGCFFYGLVWCSAYDRAIGRPSRKANLNYPTEKIFRVGS